MKNQTLASFCRILALTFTCALFSGNAAEKVFTDGLTAQQILEKMGTIYASCKSYRDSGFVTNNNRLLVFRTAFVRPDQFRFEYDDPTPKKPYIVRAKADEARTWWYLKPGVDKKLSLESGIAGATGVSGGSAQTIPALLLPDRIGGVKLTSMTDLVRLPDEALDKTACFKLQGKVGDVPMTLWLEKTTYLIRRIKEVMDLGRITGKTELITTTTVYTPEMDKEVPAKELEFNAPTSR